MVHMQNENMHRKDMSSPATAQIREAQDHEPKWTCSSCTPRESADRPNRTRSTPRRTRTRLIPASPRRCGELCARLRAAATDPCSRCVLIHALSAQHRRSVCRAAMGPAASGLPGRCAHGHRTNVELRLWLEDADHEDGRVEVMETFVEIDVLKTTSWQR
ncbi:transmembrane protein 60 isoform X1 [Brachyhypopomus gauderio]|uniref:transmembrane protein 60 isoform X1 n=1 Tax=Brachyhypopomus gauderio TaxID=698409 RepID=UPI004042B79A